MIRPVLTSDSTSDVALHALEKPSHVLLKQTRESREYGPFDAVTGSIDALYDVCVREEILSSVLEGFNATILAYGQTGSGKTFTMGSGERRADSPPGLIQRLVADLFERLPVGARVSARFIQVYCEQVHDLLANDGEEHKSIKMDPRDHMRFTVADAKEVPCDTAQAVFDVLRSGVHKRKTGETRMNAHSSRSHAIFTLRLELRSAHTGDAPLLPCINLVDLAGSENSKKADTAGKRQREGNNINRSLTELSMVIDAHSRKQAFVNVRNSALTMLLRDSLGGNARTLMVACVNPTSGEVTETKNTLEYASRMRQITNRPRIERGATSAEAVAVRDMARDMARTQSEREKDEARLQLQAMEESAQQQREAHEAKTLQLEATIAELRSQLEAKGRELAEKEQLLGEREQQELVMEAMLRTAEQRFEQRAKQLRETESRLASCISELGLADDGNDEVHAALRKALSEAHSAREALEMSRKECAEYRRQLDGIEAAQSSVEMSPEYHRDWGERFLTGPIRRPHMATSEPPAAQLVPAEASPEPPAAQLETDLEPSDGLLAARETASFSPKDAPNVAKAPNVENKVPNVEKVPNSARSARKRSIDTDGRVRTDQPLKSTLGGGSAAESSFKNCGPQHSSHYLTGQSAELGGGQARWPECRPQAKHIKK